MTAIENTQTHDSHNVIANNSARAWLVVISGALFFLYEFVQMNLLSSINQDLMATFRVDATHLSLLSFAYLLANVLFLLPAGQLLDRFSTKKIILTSLCICVFGTACFAMTRLFSVAVICRFLTGIGSAFCFLSSIRLASRWFPAKRMALVSGLIVTMGMIGGYLAQAPFSAIVDIVGWRHGMLLDAGLGLFIIAVIACLVADHPPHKRHHIMQDQQSLNQLGFWKSLLAAYWRKQNWCGGLYTCMMNLPMFLLGALWGSLYLEQVEHFTRFQSTQITGMLFLGTVIGSPCAGWISDKLGRRKLPMIVGAMIALIVISWIIFFSGMNFTTFRLLFLLLGFITSTQVISYPTIAESNPPALTATAVSIISFTTISGGAVLSPLFGWVLDMHSQNKLINGVTYYALSDYHHAMLIMPIAFLLALIAAINLKETYCQQL